MANTTIAKPPYAASSSFSSDQDTVLPAGGSSSITTSHPPSTRGTKSPSPRALPSPLTRKRSSTSPSPHPKRRTTATTPNACTACKRAKAKCSGGQPACTRCCRRGEDAACRYEAAVRFQKEAMIEEIHELRRRYSRAQLILQAVGGEEGEATVTALRRGDSYEEIEEGLRVGERDRGRKGEVLPDRRRQVAGVGPAALADA
ncbi:hypothetical protein MMC11_000755 [Xylographa trunciseda]|nr:hypothetical protein [Xylographa trunciseda]